MAPKYELLPSEPDYSPRKSSSSDYASSSSPSTTYPPPYSYGDSPSDYTSFINDLEEDAPRRQRSHNGARRAMEPLPAFDSDPRFRMKTPSPFTRAALLAFIVFLFWLAFNLRKAVWVAGGMGGAAKQEVEEIDSSY